MAGQQLLVSVDARRHAEPEHRWLAHGPRPLDLTAVDGAHILGRACGTMFGINWEA